MEGKEDTRFLRYLVFNKMLNQVNKRGLGTCENALYRQGFTKRNSHNSVSFLHIMCDKDARSVYGLKGVLRKDEFILSLIEGREGGRGREKEGWWWW